MSEKDPQHDCWCKENVRGLVIKAGDWTMRAPMLLPDVTEWSEQDFSDVARVIREGVAMFKEREAASSASTP